jgi:hypothetical protein
MSLFEEFFGYHRMQDSVCVCSDVNSLTEELRFQQDPEERRIFICVWKLKLKAVLLNIRHVKLPISLDHSLAQNETFVIMPLLTKCI